MRRVDRRRFDLIRRKHGGYASWAVWAPVGRRPKSNVGDLSVFHIASHPETLALLNPTVVMVGLNISRNSRRRSVERLRNFHSSYPRANDFKIRHAFAGTPFYGAYMTDVIKNTPILKSSDLMKHLKTHPELVKSGIRSFREEMKDLRCRRPTILAFGREAARLLREHLLHREYSRLICLTHYSHRVAKEKYRKEVMAQIAAHPRGRGGDER